MASVLVVDVFENVEAVRDNTLVFDPNRSRFSIFVGSLTVSVEFAADRDPRRKLHLFPVFPLPLLLFPPRDLLSGEVDILAFSDQKRVAGVRGAAVTTYGLVSVVTNMAVFNNILSGILFGMKWIIASNGLCSGSVDGVENMLDRLSPLMLPEDLDILFDTNWRLFCEERGVTGELPGIGASTTLYRNRPATCLFLIDPNDSSSSMSS